MKILLNRMIDGVTDLVIYGDLNRVMEKLKDTELDITYVVTQD